MMMVQELVENLTVVRVQGDLDQLVSEIQYDSRKVEKDHAFVAIKGFQADGHRFVPQAYERGARVFFVEHGDPLPGSAFIYLENTRRALSDLARVFYNYPDHKLKVIGITGTTGKTTTAYLIHSILKSAGWNPGLLTTIETFDGVEWQPAERTTPESLDILRGFHTMVRARLKSAAMEVSSHALSLHRVEGIPFVAGVFTNLGRDHLDFHQTIEDYFLAKRKLFENFSENQRVILNDDDPYSGRIKPYTGGEIFTYSRHNPGASVKYRSHRLDKRGLQVTLALPSGDLAFQSALLGDFNIYNLMAAVTIAVSLGIPENHMVAGIQDLERVPGRCEFYPTPSGISIYIDYAHTAESLRNILKAVWETRPATLMVVFGAGGDRDRGKRPEMGKAADDYADKIVLTSDNPRSEDPMRIIQEINTGISDKSKVTIVTDREEAIWQALQTARPEDAVVIAGKGHETYQEIQGRKIPFDDHRVVEKFFHQHGWTMGRD